MMNTTTTSSRYGCGTGLPLRSQPERRSYMRKKALVNCSTSAHSRRGAVSALSLLLALCLLLPFLPPIGVAQQTEPKLPVSTLTMEQKAELDALNKQAVVAYGKGDTKTAVKLWQQILERA